MRYARAPGILLPIGCKLAKVCGNVDGDAVESGERKIETSVSFGMKAQGPAASSLLKRFPDHGEIIVKLYAENEDFRELCDHWVHLIVEQFLPKTAGLIL